MDRSLVINPEKCTGCRLCELACSFAKEGECNPARSRIQMVLFQDEAVYIPVTCMQCDEAWCAQVCPSSALGREDSPTRIALNESKCVGCKVCTLACPFGTIFYISEKSKVAKCDLCNGQPECALLCPTGAIQYGEIGTVEAAKRKTLSRKLASAIKEATV